MTKWTKILGIFFGVSLAIFMFWGLADNSQEFSLDRAFIGFLVAASLGGLPGLLLALFNEALHLSSSVNRWVFISSSFMQILSMPIVVHSLIFGHTDRLYLVILGQSVLLGMVELLLHKKK